MAQFREAAVLVHSNTHKFTRTRSHLTQHCNFGTGILETRKRTPASPFVHANQHILLLCHGCWSSRCVSSYRCKFPVARQLAIIGSSSSLHINWISCHVPELLLIDGNRRGFTSHMHASTRLLTTSISKPTTKQHYTASSKSVSTSVSQQANSTTSQPELAVSRQSQRRKFGFRQIKATPNQVMSSKGSCPQNVSDPKAPQTKEGASILKQKGPNEWNKKVKKP